jgi:hypothetical protein
MPKTDINYTRTSIYKIVCKDLDVKEIYVGSTTNIVQRRFSHASQCMNPKSGAYNYKVYQCIRKLGGWENWNLVLVEHFPCASSEEQRMRERHWIEILGATMNSNNPIKKDLKIVQKQTIQVINICHGKIDFPAWFASTFTIGKDLKCPKQKVDSATMQRTSFIDQLKRAGIEFSYASQERKTIDGIPYKGFYYGFELK